MKQFLQRGCQLADGLKITRVAVGTDSWQIYLTNKNTYVLAASIELYDKWVNSGIISKELFFLNEESEPCMVFVSRENYIISSVAEGPYPTDGSQIEAFSIAFNSAVKSQKCLNLQDALYIEEYSLFLPTTFNSDDIDNKRAYGKWLTAGINISIDSFERVSQVMSWLPKEALVKSVKLAGFEVEEHKEKNFQLDSKENVNAGNVPLPEGKFTLLGRPELEKFFNENIIDIVLNQEKYKRMGVLFPGATILHGPPGCGKTYAVERLIEYLGWKRFDIDSAAIASSYIHDTSKKISQVFQEAIESAPSVIVIDEMEAFLSNRNMSANTGTYHMEELAEFLRRIPEATSKGVLIFAMTNMIESIDPAILRRGRFDNIIEVKMATAAEIEAFLESSFSKLPIDETVKAGEIAVNLENHPMSDVAFVIKEAGRFAVKNNLELLNSDCFKVALNSLPKQKERKRIGFSSDN